MLQFLYERNDLSKNTQEVPATVPIYEGHLYWYSSEKQKWKWRLFRFDGLSFICLATRKVKLPRDTPIVQHDNDSNDPPSPISPLLATPIKHSYTKGKVLMASHYQLPTWSLNLKQVVSISLLVRDDSKLQQKQQYNCFCLRTVDKEYYLLKARKYKDLDRWLFILTKAWNWVQFEQHIMQRLPSTPPQLPPLNISSFCDNSRQSTQPPTPPLPKLPERQQQDHHPILSAEKEKWIHEWRNSLQPMTMPPYHKPRHSTTSLVSNYSPKPRYDGEGYYQQPQQRPASLMDTTLSNVCPFIKVKERRSDEIRNWIPGNYQDHQDYDVNYFQDANTTDHANGTSSKHSGDEQQLQQSSLHYHRSSRGKTVQIFNDYHHHHGQQHNLHASSPTLPFNHHSPLSELSKIESTDDVYRLLQLQRSIPSSSPSSSTIQVKEKQRPQSTAPTYNTIYHPHRRPIVSAAVPAAPAASSLPSIKPTYTHYASTTVLTPLKKHLPFMKSSSTIGRGSFNSGSTPTSNGAPFGRSKASLHSLV